MKKALASLTSALFTAGLLTATQSHAETKTVYIGMNGGPMEKAYTSEVLPEFEKANNVKVVIVPGTSSDILAKLLANKAKPQIHVVFLDDGVMARAVSMGVCQQMSAGPEIQQLYPFARMKDDIGAGVQLGMTGIAYNTKLFKEKGWAPPTSWMDFADPKYKDKVVFQSASSSTFGLHGFLMINRLEGGTEKNVEPGFTKWQSTVGKNVIEYIPNSAKISEMVQTGQAGLFPLTPTAAGDLQTKGIPVAYVNPKEGPVLLLVDECVVANNPDPELAQKLAAFLISASAQTKAASAGRQIPTNRQAKMTDAMQQQLGNLDDLVKKVNTVDWDVINANRPQWDARWNRQIER